MRFGVMPMGIIAILNALRAKGYRVLGIKIQLYYTVNVVGETKQKFEDTLFKMKYMRFAGNRQVLAHLNRCP